MIVFGGDFRQTLPVIRMGNKSETIAASLTNSFLWPSLCKLQLDENMRALLNPMFTKFLLQIGDGKINSTDDDIVCLPPEMITKCGREIDDLDALIHHVYPTIF